jgi:ribosomal protein S24E
MAITIRARRRQVNKLLSRKEIVLDVFHEGVANVSHNGPERPRGPEVQG